MYCQDSELALTLDDVEDYVQRAQGKLSRIVARNLSLFFRGRWCSVPEVLPQLDRQQQWEVTEAIGWLRTARSLLLSVRQELGKGSPPEPQCDDFCGRLVRLELRVDRISRWLLCEEKR
ncbi:hypothetical protein ACSSZE_13750 [Acidithiobacillus caldus]